jgi:hypothetical protein
MTEKEEPQSDEPEIEPGVPLRPDPGSPETRGGSRTEEKKIAGEEARDKRQGAPGGD